MALQIYVEAGCHSCGRALDLADEVMRSYPDLTVEIIDISDTEKVLPDAVFAVPTYVLDGSVVSLGNPSQSELSVLIEAALAGHP